MTDSHTHGLVDTADTFSRMSMVGARPVIAQRLAHLSPIVSQALQRAALAMTEMTGVRFNVSSTSLGLACVTQVPEIAGGADLVALGVYFAFHGEGQGHLLLLMDEDGGREVAGLLLGEDPATINVSEELPASALAESGNVSCSAFLNALGDTLGLRLGITPPAVVQDMRGAILDALAADIASAAEEALVISTRFTMGDADATTHSLDARLLVVPTPETLEAFLERGALVGAQNSW
ncbi:MAG: chemotaxis protein CheC [Chloroflexota bacterium]